MSETTFKTHLSRVYDKLGVSDRAAAVRVAYERGLIGAGSSGWPSGDAVGGSSTELSRVRQLPPPGQAGVAEGKAAAE